MNYSDFGNVDIGNSPYFGAQDWGDGSSTMGYGTGQGFFDFSQVPGIDTSSFQSPDGAIDSGALEDYFAKNNMSLRSRDRPGFADRGLFSGNKLMGNVQTTATDDPYFQLAGNLASSLVNPAGIGGLGDIFGGGVMGGFMAGMNGGDPLKGIVTGGLLPNMPNVAEYAGIPADWQKGVNGALKGGVSAAVQGGDVGKGMFTGGLPGFGNSLGKIFGSLGDNFQGLDDMQGSLGGTYDSGDGESSATMGGYASPGQLDANAQVAALTQSDPSASPVRERLMSMMESGFSNPFTGKSVGIGDTLGGLLQLWSSNQQRRRASQMYGGLRDMYGPNSAYSQQLMKQLTRQDAASGRRSQYGSRNVELQARLADLNSRNAPQLANLSNMKDSGTMGMFNSMLNLGAMFGPESFSKWIGKSPTNGGLPMTPRAPSNPAMMPTIGGADYMDEWKRIIGIPGGGA